MGLYTENNVLVGAAPRLLAEEQPGGQAGRLAHHGHVVRPPRLTVFVHHPHPSAGGAVPDALLGPETIGENSKAVEKEYKSTKNTAEALESLTRRGPLKHLGHQTSRWATWD